MSEPSQQTESTSLWECLHDGAVVSVESDLLARTLTVVIDSAFHREFHTLPTDTRFRLVGENVCVVESLELEPWPGAVEPPRETPWKLAQEQRQRDYEKGRLISTDWKAFMAGVNGNEDYEILDATLTQGRPLSILELGILYMASNYCTVRVHAESFKFSVGESDVSLEAFLSFGAAYWDDFSKRSLARSNQNGST